jgi:nicotinamide mononucleotide transporter
MLETAFTLLATPVTWLEVLAFVLALANIACNVWEIHWGWPLTIAASALYAWLFYASNLYGEGSVNVFFALAAVWGWWQWLRGHRADSDAPLQVEKLDAWGLKKTALAWLVLWLVCSALLHFVTDSDVVWADGFVTAGSIVGTVLLGRKFVDNWPTWVLVNVASIALFAHKGLALTVVLYVIFLGLAFWGWWGWQQRYRHRNTVNT